MKCDSCRLSEAVWGRPTISAITFGAYSTLCDDCYYELQRVAFDAISMKVSQLWLNKGGEKGLFMVGDSEGGKE